VAVKEKRSETIVGLFLLVGLIMLGTLIVLYGNLGKFFEERYPITVEFADGTGVIKGSQILLGGAQIGEVSGTPILTKGRRVRIPLSIDEDIKLPKEAVFQIAGVSLLGDKAVVVSFPEGELSGEMISENAILQGGGASGLEALQDDAAAIASDARALMSEAKDSFAKVDEAFSSFEEITAKLNITLDKVNSGILSDENVSGLSNSIANLNETSESVKRASTDIRPILLEAQEAIKGVKGATDQAENFLVTANKEVKNIQPALAEVPATMRSFKQTAEKAAITMDQATTTLKKADKAIIKADKAITSLSSDKGLLGSLTTEGAVKDDAETFLRNLRKHGILGYRDAETSETINPEDDRYRGRRR